MKKLIILLLLVISLGVKAQYVRKVNDSTYTYVPAKSIGTYSKEGVIYPLFQTSSGKLYIWVVSKKSGKPYKSYLKL